MLQLPNRFQYKLCRICIKLLKDAVVFQKSLLNSLNTYNKYIQTLHSNGVSNSALLSVFIDERAVVEQHLQIEYISTNEILDTENLDNQNILIPIICEEEIIDDATLLHDNINGSIY